MENTQKIIFGCGHKSKIIILDNNPISIAAYLEWNESTGYEGDKSECFDCFTKKLLQAKPQEATSE